MSEAIKALSSYVKCDADGCDWIEKDVVDMEGWRNQPCPKCGANVLTDADWAAWQKFNNITDIVNSLLAPFAKDINPDGKDNPTGIRVGFDGKGNMTMTIPADQKPDGDSA